MKEKDLRYITTNAILTEAVFRLIEEKKDLSAVSIKSLCLEAGINRSTFYSHFKSVKDLYSYIQQSVFNDLMTTIEKNKNLNRLWGNNTSAYVDILNFAKRNERAIRLMIVNSIDTEFLYGMLTYGQKTFEDIYKDKVSAEDAELISYYYNYIGFGVTGVLLTWVSTGCVEPIDKMAKVLKRMIAASLKHIKCKQSEQSEK